MQGLDTLFTDWSFDIPQKPEVISISMQHQSNDSSTPESVIMLLLKQINDNTINATSNSNIQLKHGIYAGRDAISHKNYEGHIRTTMQ